MNINHASTQTRCETCDTRIDGGGTVIEDKGWEFCSRACMHEARRAGGEYRHQKDSAAVADQMARGQIVN